MDRSREALQEEMQARAVRRVLEGSTWLTAKQIASLGVRRPLSTVKRLAHWQRKQQLFSLRVEGSELYPDYAFDPQERYRPRPELEPILKVFCADLDGWRLAFWFDSPNSYLDGRRPRECYWLHPAEALVAARMEVQGPLNG